MSVTINRKEFQDWKTPDFEFTTVDSGSLDILVTFNGFWWISYEMSREQTLELYESLKVLFDGQ